MHVFLLFSDQLARAPFPQVLPVPGLRQGDPLSPLLFIIAIERLSHCIQDAVNNVSWIPLKFGRGGPSISHLLFADDIHLVAQASSSNAQVISDILGNFATSSGQTVNKAKSCILFSHNTPSHIANAISGQLGIASTSSLGRTLEFPSSWVGKVEMSPLFLLTKSRVNFQGGRCPPFLKPGVFVLLKAAL